MNFKFTASSVDEIEQSKKLPIENCITDNTVSTLLLFIMKGLVDDNGTVGVSRSVAINKLDLYLAEKDKDELMFDIMEALVKAGFLSRGLDVAKIRKEKDKQLKALDEVLS